MGIAKEYWFIETERWILKYPEWKRSLPSTPSLFDYQDFNRVHQIEEAMTQLEEEEQKLLDLLYRKKKTYIAISIALHMSEVTVYRTKAKVLLKLAKRLDIYKPKIERAKA